MTDGSVSSDVARVQDQRSAVSRSVGAFVRVRVEAVMVAAAAVLAIVPLSCSVFWGPMAGANMGGLIVATR